MGLASIGIMMFLRILGSGSLLVIRVLQSDEEISGNRFRSG
jgi:hypothetical protein